MTYRELTNTRRQVQQLQAEVERLRQALHGHLPDAPPESTLPGAETRSQATVRRMLEYVHQHLGRPMSLKLLAGELDMNADYLSTLFAQATGVHFHHYLEELRLAEARKLLSQSGRSLAEVAAAVGYGSESALRYAFKRQTGLAPSAWQYQKVRADGQETQESKNLDGVPRSQRLP